MDIAAINGGLGNQAFQYIFARSITLKTGRPCILDNSYFLNKTPKKHTNGCSVEYRLGKVFGVKPQFLSDLFTADVLEELHKNEEQGYSIPQQLKDGGIDLAMVAETSDLPKFDGNIFWTPANEYNPLLYQCSGNFYYHGYWINKWWFYNCYDEIMKELQFPPLRRFKNQRYAQRMAETESIAVHIRRFSGEGYNWDIQPEWYQEAMRQFQSRLPNATYFVFSDDLAYCAAHKELYGLDLANGRIIYVEGNEAPDDNYIDMQLMSLCKHMIIANSSFSYLAALLNQNSNKLIANPTNREV